MKQHNTKGQENITLMNKTDTSIENDSIETTTNFPEKKGSRVKRKSNEKYRWLFEYIYEKDQWNWNFEREWNTNLFEKI